MCPFLYASSRAHQEFVLFFPIHPFLHLPRRCLFTYIQVALSNLSTLTFHHKHTVPLNKMTSFTISDGQLDGLKDQVAVITGRIT